MKNQHRTVGAIIVGLLLLAGIGVGHSGAVSSAQPQFSLTDKLLQSDGPTVNDADELENGTTPHGELWNVTIGESGTVGIRDVAETPDGGHIVVGYRSPDEGATDGYIAKIGPNRSVQWNTTIGGKQTDRFNAIASTRDGNYLLAGDTVSYGRMGFDGWLVKISPDGEVLWQRTPGIHGDEEMFTSLTATEDGGYLLAGFTDVHTVDGEESGWAVKVNATGRVIWSRTYDRDVPGVDNVRRVFNSVSRTEDGYVFAGFVGSPRAPDGWAVKIRPNGTTVWNNAYGGNESDVFMVTTAGFQDETLLAGSTESLDKLEPDGWVLGVHPNGTEAWNATAGGADIEQVNAMTLLSDGEVALAGHSRSGTPGTNAWLASIRSNDGERWNVTFGDERSKVWGIDRTSEGRLTLVGFIESNAGQSADGWLLRTDEGPAFELSVEPEKSEIGEHIEYMVTNESDGDGQIVRFEWYVDDNESIAGTGTTFRNYFNESGTHEVTVTAIDDDGIRTSKTTTVRVTDPENTSNSAATEVPGFTALAGFLGSFLGFVIGLEVRN